MFKLKTLSGASKYALLAKLVNSVSLHYGNSIVSVCCLTIKTVNTDRTQLLDETISSLRRMKEYSRFKCGTHVIIATPRMAQLLGEVKKKTKKGWRINMKKRAF